jgi:hypothetical protein
VSLSQVFHPDTTFVLKLTDNTWVLYQETNREFVKAKNLSILMKKTFKIRVRDFHKVARELTKLEYRMLDDIFGTVDNYNLAMGYIIEPLNKH